MKIKTLNTGKKKKRKVFVVSAETIEDQILEDSGENLRVEDYGDAEESEEDSDDSPLEYKAKGKKVPAKVIRLKGLDPDKVYGIECRKFGSFNIRQVRPATGIELQRFGNRVFDWDVVNYFYNSPVFKGFRLLSFPNDSRLCAICTWTGPTYTPPKAGMPPRKIRFGKSKELNEQKKSNRRIKIGKNKTRIRMGSRR